MASGSFIAVTPGAGAKLATGPTYTENANVVQDEKVIYGEQYLAEYRAHNAVTYISTATLDSHIFQLMAGASLNVYVRRIRVYQRAAATTAGIYGFELFRISTAGTGGTAFTPAPMDTTDAASGATFMTLPTVKGTTGVAAEMQLAYFIQTLGASQNGGTLPLLLDFDFRGTRQKSLRVPAGTANGIALQNRDAVAAATVVAVVEFTEAPF